MRIIKNKPMVQALSKNLVSYEMSNVAMTLQTPTILTTYYRIEPDLSTTITGFQNVDDFIHPESPIVYDRIENLPMYGIPDLNYEGEFDEETGFDENYQSSAVIYPNTVLPKPNDCFTVNDSTRPLLYVVTGVKPTMVRSNPFIEISFRLQSVRPDTIDQLNRQVKNVYTTSLSSIGSNRSLILAKDSVTDINAHLRSYMEIAQLYTMLFYDENKAAFVFDGLPGERGERRCFIDMTLWRFMFDEGIIIYDSLISYADSNGEKTIERIYTGCPDVYIDEHAYHRSIIYRIYDKQFGGSVKRSEFDHYRFPYIWEPTSRITKYQGQNIWYLDAYLEHQSAHDITTMFYIWDDEFLCRIRHNDPYPDLPITSNKCSACRHPCMGAPVLCYNPTLRNVIIKWFNGGTIDWDSLTITDDRTVENYYLIPIVMGIYKKYIQSIGI